jgi:hypothetical protein
MIASAGAVMRWLRLSSTDSIQSAASDIPSSCLDIGTPAVLLVATVEAESYDPRETAAMLQSLSEEGLLDASIGVLPFLFFAQKARYRVVADASPSKSEIADLTDSLERALSGARASVGWAPCGASNVVSRAVATAVSRGHRKIVVAELYVAAPADGGSHTRDSGIWPGVATHHIAFTEPLFDAGRILAMLASRVARMSGDGTGVVLVGQATRAFTHEPEVRRTGNDLPESPSHAAI